MLKQAKSPYGFRELLAYKKAEELQAACSNLTSHFSHSKTLSSLSDQMNRSARSAKQNIVEGWKRNSTKEYYDFLGFSIGANTELEEDCNDIWNGIYPELLIIKGIMGEMGGRGKPLLNIEKLKFYPLDQTLPPVVQLKLRCKELNYLLQKLQNSLGDKMIQEKTLPKDDVAYKTKQNELQADREMEELFRETGLKRMEDGRYIQE